MECRPFTMFFRRTSDMPFLSYARPTGPLKGNLGKVIEEVKQAFHARKRVPRWEWIAELAPELEAALVSAGLPEVERRPLMVVTPERFKPVTTDCAEIRLLTPNDDLMALSRTMMKAFGMVDEAHVGQVAEDTRQMILRGAKYLAVFAGGIPIAGGEHSPIGKTTEVAGIGTDPDFQRRGIGSAITSATVADAIKMGCDCIFLSAADEEKGRFYAKLGFEEVGTAMDVMEPQGGKLGN